MGGMRFLLKNASKSGFWEAKAIVPQAFCRFKCVSGSQNHPDMELGNAFSRLNVCKKRHGAVLEVLLNRSKNGSGARVPCGFVDKLTFRNASWGPCALENPSRTHNFVVFLGPLFGTFLSSSWFVLWPFFLGRGVGCASSAPGGNLARCFQGFLRKSAL